MTPGVRREFSSLITHHRLFRIRSAANGGFALGNDRFKAEIAAMLGQRVERLRDRESPQTSS